MTFTNTKPTATSAVHTGITNLRLIRPGYAGDSTQVYTNEFLDSLAPFSTIRFMGFTETNNSDPAYPAVTDWSDRHVTTDATQQSYGAKHGAAWEYVEYRPDGSYITPPAASAKCASCHLKAGAAKDFVFGGKKS